VKNLNIIDNEHFSHNSTWVFHKGSDMQAHVPQTLKGLKGTSAHTMT